MAGDDKEKLSRIENLIEAQRKEQDELRSKHEREMGFALAYGDKNALSNRLRQNAKRVNHKNPDNKEKRYFVFQDGLGRGRLKLNIDVKFGEHSHENKKIDLKKYEEKMFSADDIFKLLESIRSFMQLNGIEIDKDIDYSEAADWDKGGYRSEAGDILKGILFGTNKPNEGRYYLKNGKILVCDFDRFYVCDNAGLHPRALLLKNEK